MKPKNNLLLMIAAGMVVLMPMDSFAWGTKKQGGLFDVAARKAELQKPEFATIRAYCMAETGVSQPDEKMPEPVKGLKETEGYGTDRSLSEFAWYMMIHGGRAMAGDAKSEGLVKEALITWADANALHDTEEVHDAYYALKRGLLPIIVNYTIVRESFSPEDQKKIENWLDPLVRMIDKKFDGDVDMNNHRYLADSVLTLWGDIIGDSGLYDKGRERFEIALEQMRPDGSLPLETRRGARALWYVRQSITNLSVIAEIYARNGDDLYGLTRDGKSLSLLTNYFITGARAPSSLVEYTSENYIPGPSDDFLNQDMAVLHQRGGKRHYMSFAHLYLKHFPETEISAARLKALMDETGFKELPLIDDYIGGNATCFWGKP
jgi:poly(beta-D-mannuronate) lyase